MQVPGGGKAKGATTQKIFAKEEDGQNEPLLAVGSDATWQVGEGVRR